MRCIIRTSNIFRYPQIPKYFTTVGPPRGSISSCRQHKMVWGKKTHQLLEPVYFIYFWGGSTICAYLFCNDRFFSLTFLRDYIKFRKRFFHVKFDSILSITVQKKVMFFPDHQYIFLATWRFNFHAVKYFGSIPWKTEYIT